MAGRPGKTKLDKMRANAWFTYVSRAAGGASAYQLEQMNLGDVDGGGGENVWSRYRRGDRVPGRELINTVDLKFPGSKKIFEDGPGSLFKLKEAKSPTEALTILYNASQGQERGRGFRIDYIHFLDPERISHERFFQLYLEIQSSYIGNLTPIDLSVIYVYRRFLDFSFIYRLKNQKQHPPLWGCCFKTVEELIKFRDSSLRDQLMKPGLNPDLASDLLPETSVMPIEIPDSCFLLSVKNYSDRTREYVFKTVEELMKYKYEPLLNQLMETGLDPDLASDLLPEISVMPIGVPDSCFLLSVKANLGRSSAGRYKK